MAGLNLNSRREVKTFENGKLVAKRSVLVTFACLVAALVIAYGYWTSTPYCALANIALAMQNHDADAIEKYIDIDSVVGTAFDDLLDGPGKRIVANYLPGSAAFLGINVLRYFRADIVGVAHDQVLKAIRRQSSKMPSLPDFASVSQTLRHPCPVSTPQQLRTSDNPAGELKRHLRDFGINKSGFRGVKYVNIDGRSGSVALEFYSPSLQKSWIAVFEMEDFGGYWRVTRLANLSQLIDNYIAARNTITM